jgi:hypothetical protein
MRRLEIIGKLKLYFIGPHSIPKERLEALEIHNSGEGWGSVQ